MVKLAFSKWFYNLDRRERYEQLKNKAITLNAEHKKLQNYIANGSIHPRSLKAIQDRSMRVAELRREIEYMVKHLY